MRSVMRNKKCMRGSLAAQVVKDRSTRKAAWRNTNPTIKVIAMMGLAITAAHLYNSCKCKY